MQFKNTETQYGAVTKTFHWTIAVLVLCLLAVGLTMDDLPLGAFKLTVYNLHKSFGITVLALMICRICWHIYNHRPNAVDTLQRWEKIASSAVHYALYVLLIAMPITGWLFSSAAGRTVHVFGLITLPDLVIVDKAVAKNFRELHGDIGTLIMIVVGLHIGAALRHHFIQKDSVLKRMLPAISFLALLLFATPASADVQPPAQAGVKQWSMIHEKSSISFRPKQMNEEFKGTFDTFAASISFDPDDLAHSKAVIDIQLGTAHTGAPDRDENLKGADWFNVAQFPDAKFETTSFRRADQNVKLKPGEGLYVAEGTLTIKNISLPVTLPFSLMISTDATGKETATMAGSVTLDRSKFQVGTGQWVDTSIIANDVPVDVQVVAISHKTGK